MHVVLERRIGLSARDGNKLNSPRGPLTSHFGSWRKNSRALDMVDRGRKRELKEVKNSRDQQKTYKKTIYESIVRPGRFREKTAVGSQPHTGTVACKMYRQRKIF